MKPTERRRDNTLWFIAAIAVLLVILLFGDGII
jgi:hypothetical protein